MKKRSTLDKKLISYSLMATGFLTLSPLTKADVVFSEIDPDLLLVNNTFSVDFDGDGTPEFSITHLSSSSSSTSSGYFYSFSYQAAVLNAETAAGSFVGQAGLATTAYSAYFLHALSTGIGIGSAGPFAGNSYGYFGGRGYFAYAGPSGSSTYLISYGFWNNVIDHYAGVSFQLAGQTHYGWIRCDVSTDYGSITLKSFAYENVPGVPIFAGDTIGVMAAPADIATALNLTDIADNTNGLDLQLNFTKAVDEATINEYRLMVVKSADAPAFDLPTALSIPAGNFLPLGPTGSDVSTNFGAIGKDVDGDLIVEGAPYKAFVLSMADGVNANINALSTSSNEITLSTFSAPADVALAVNAMDNSDFADGRDVLVSFNPAADETTLADYRIVVVKEAAAGSFNTVTATALVGAQVKSVVPTGSAVATSLAMNSEDSDGDLIVEGQAYKAFVLSMPDGVNATDPTLSTPSATFTLQHLTALNSPDPSHWNITSQAGSILITQAVNQPIKARIFKLNGQLLAEKNIQGSGAVFSHNWSKGELVLVQIATGKSTTIAKIVIE